MKESIFHILFAGIQSGFIDISFLKKWTEELIDISDKPQYWLIDLTLCSDSDSALNILRKYQRDSGKKLSEGYGETLLGFLCLSFENKKLSLDKFFSKIIDVLDGYGSIYGIGDLEVEMLSQFYQGDQFMSEEFLKFVSSKFGEYREKSNQLYRYLIDAKHSFDEE